MTNKEAIAHITEQLALKHERASTRQRLEIARMLFEAAEVDWGLPGRQASAQRFEEQAKEVLRALNQPITVTMRDTMKLFIAYSRKQSSL